MREQAFETLGIPPTGDGRAIRAAFLRLARIYHPDRFTGMPEDVRVEAERRMKEATAAYESLRGPKRATQPEHSGLSEAELRARKEKYRKLLEAKRIEEEHNQARWRRWDAIEREARARAEVEAEIAAMIARGTESPVAHAAAPSTPASAQSPVEDAPQSPSRSRLVERLDAARRGERATLVPLPRSG